jgi:hypothetical protein
MTKRDHRFPRIVDNRPVLKSHPGSGKRITLTRENPKTGFEYEVELLVRAKICPFARGRFSGPFEDCYPNEGGYAENLRAFFQRSDGFWVEYTSLDESEETQILDELYQESGGD